jgi:transposase-like protein
MNVSLASRATGRTVSSPRGPSRASSHATHGIPNPIARTPPDFRNGLLARELEYVLSQRGALNEAEAIRGARCLARGETTESVAAAFGVSVTTLYTTLRRYNIPSPTQFDPSVRGDKIRLSRASRRAPRLTKQLAREAAALIAGNASIASVARDLGLNPQSLRLGLKRHGLSTAIPGQPRGRRPFKLTKDNAVAAARLIAQGQSVVSAARGLGVGLDTLRDALRRHGLKPMPRPKA